MACIDTLRLSVAEQTELLQHLEGAGGGRGAEYRQHDRVSYRPPAGIVVSLEHPGGSAGLFLVRPRNLSPGGIGFLHGGYLHRGSRCGMALRTAEGTRHTIVGRIAWCRHVRGHIHEAGVAFEETIEVNEFINTCVRAEVSAGTGPGAGGPPRAENDENDVATTSTPMPALNGRMLYVEDAVDERELLKFQLDQLGVELHVAGDVVEAMTLVEQHRFDLILTGIWLPGLTGLDLIEQVRTMDAPPPMLALTADPSEALHRDALERGAARVLVKPYTFQLLVEAVEPYLLAGGNDTGGDSEAQQVDRPLVSHHWANPAMRPLIVRYVDRLDEQTQQLEMLLERSSSDPLLRKLVLDIKGAAGNYGYPTVSEAARRLYELIKQDVAADELFAACAHLRRLSEAARRSARNGA